MTSNGQTELETVRKALPADLATRIISARQREDRWTLVVDGEGLDAAARERMEAQLHSALAPGDADPAPAIAFMGERVRRRIIAIGSGKGGVGKSTVTANLAVALKRAGVKVGVIDADIYGPSQPILLKSEDLKPEAEGETLQPVRGVADIPMLSMGHLVAKGRALAWRGPMAGRALAQLFEANWGDTELLLVDLPPGTGDVQITMLQKFRPDGAVIVSTPRHGRARCSIRARCRSSAWSRTCRAMSAPIAARRAIRSVRAGWSAPRAGWTCRSSGAFR